MHRAKRVLTAVAVTGLLLLLSLSILGQERFGEINGVVTDPTGAVVPNAKVILTNKDTNRVTNLTAGGDGNFLATNLEPGRYKMRVEAQGFAASEVPDINLLVGKTLKMDARLEVGATTETVQVSEGAPLIDTTSTMIAHNITSEEFDRLPKARTFQSLVTLSPSVNSGTLENGFQVNGASSAENQFNIDGISTNSVITGASRQDAVFEILQEVQVKTGGIEAEYGGALGGVISAITKSGGNNFHGDVHYYFTGNPISAGAPQRMLMDPTNLLTTTYIQDYNFDRNSHEAGYSLGGYFIKNRLYFFSAASPQFIEESRKYYSVDWQPVSLTRSTRYWQAYNKVSADITHSLRATAGYLWSPSSGQGTLPGTNGYGNQVTSSVSSIQANQIIGYFSPQANYNVNLDWTISPTAFLSIKAARFWDNYKK